LREYRQFELAKDHFIFQMNANTVVVDDVTYEVLPDSPCRVIEVPEEASELKIPDCITFHGKTIPVTEFFKASSFNVRYLTIGVNVKTIIDGDSGDETLKWETWRWLSSLQIHV
jgi:hypothetical protein